MQSIKFFTNFSIIHNENLFLLFKIKLGVKKCQHKEILSDTFLWDKYKQQNIQWFSYNDKMVNLL